MDRVEQMQGITIKPLRIIEGADGNVMHALKESENSFTKFGEAYFSTVNQNAIKGWKKHTQMHSNLIVPVGEVQFVFYDDRKNSETYGCYYAINLSPAENYQRLTIEPGLWMAFKGIGKELNMVMNLASISHDPNEAINDLLADSKVKYPL
tara:strand:- start:144 stop:596 length:453 start_codon:yes stop_codon:yes gene_type:complete